MKMLLHRIGLLLAVGAALALAGCVQTGAGSGRQLAKAVPQGQISGYKIGNPYQVDGVWYYPKADYGYKETGIASWYGPGFHGRSTANGETYDENGLTAAHRTLPLPTMVQVTNLENGRSIKLRINDRGPFKNGRIIDVSRRAAQLLGFHRGGTAKVRVEIIEDESRRLAVLALSREAARFAPEPAPMVPVTVRDLEAGPDAIEAPLSTASQTAAAGPTDAANGAGTAGVNRRLKIFVPRPNGIVTTEMVRPSRIFVQAGSFTRIDNAHRLRRNLTKIGRARIAQTVVDRRRFYRVRFGPMGSVEAADKLLATLIDSGHIDARVVID
ncbi:MAG: septal ring lytic transglycosylase RlpA family protein [Kiloniellales bacterium]|jgi:rare lipoprotein A